MNEKVKASFYLREATARKLRMLAAAEGRSQSEIADSALEVYLRDRQETLEWASAAQDAFAFWDNPRDADYDGL